MIASRIAIEKIREGGGKEKKKERDRKLVRERGQWEGEHE